MPKKNSNSKKIVVSRAPAAIGTSITGQVRSINGGRTVRVSHREYIGALTTTGAALEGVNYYPLNPGDHTTFPWLAGIARRFSRFRFIKARAAFVSEQASTATGIILLSYSGDGGDILNAPNTKTEMLEYGDSLRCAPWQNAVMDLHISGQTKNIKMGNNYNAIVSTSSAFATAAGANGLQDIRAISDGVLFASASNVANGLAGDIYLEYEVELSNPVGTGATCMGVASCTGNATTPLQNYQAACPVFSELNIAFIGTGTYAGGAIAFRYVGEVLVTITAKTTAATSFPAVTVSGGGSAVSTIKSNSSGGGPAFWQASIVCNGVVTVGLAASVGFDSSYNTYVTVTPFLAADATTAFLS